MLDVELIRKVAAAEKGRRALDELTGPPAVSNTDAVLIQKNASVSDPELYTTLEKVGATELYEDLGGTYAEREGVK